VPDEKLFMRDTCEQRDGVCFGAKDDKERHACKSHEAGSCGDGWRPAIAEFLGVRPIVRMRPKSHRYKQEG